MKKTLYKKRRKITDSVYLYVLGGTNETCENGNCGGAGNGSPTPGNGCKAMGGNTVCKP